MTVDFDACPNCLLRIVDHDPHGCEDPNGQRWCLHHLPDSPPAGTPYAREWARWRSHIRRLQEER